MGFTTEAVLGPPPLTPEQLFVQMQRLRAYAVNKKLDMTDAFDEYAGSGYEKNIGIMDTQRFKSVMGILFGGELTGHTLQSICMYYGTGGLDAGGVDHVSVLWKKFSIDFDNVPLFQEPEMPVDPELMAALRAMRSEATHKRLDMTDAFEEYSGTLQEKNTGIMSKNRFRSTMGTLFRGRLNQDVLNAICIHYGVGDPDPRERGSFTKVRWKRFAIDFDNIPPPPPPPLPDPSPEIVEAMRGMNVYANLNGIDLANDFEEYMGGKDKCSSDLMPRAKFCSALGVLLGRATSLYQLDWGMLDAICACYAAGERDARDPKYHTHVQWREFAGDVNRIQPMPYLDGLQGMVHAYPQVGACGDPHDTDAARIRPVYGTTPTCCAASFGTMPSGAAGFSDAQAAGAVTAARAGKKAMGGGGGASAAAIKSTRSTQRSTGRVS